MVDDLHPVGCQSQRQDHGSSMLPECSSGVGVDCHETHFPALAAPDLGGRVGVHQHHQNPVGQVKLLGRPRVLQGTDQFSGNRIQHTDRTVLLERHEHSVVAGNQSAVHLGRSDFLAASGPTPTGQFVPPELNAVRGVACDQ